MSESEELSVTRVPAAAAAAADNGQSLCGCGTAEQDAEGRCPGGRDSNELSENPKLNNHGECLY